MQVVRYTPNMPPIGVRTAVALGLFDGVHLAHRVLLEQARDAARERGLIPAVFTFLSESEGLKNRTERIYSTEGKLALLAEAGIEIVLLCDFADLRDLTGEQFVQKILVATMGAELAVAGYNFRFGRGAAADTEELCHLMRASGGDAICVPSYEIDGSPLSATRIKELLREGRLEDANRYLGSPYRISGVVEHGRGLGRTWGIPTVNLPLPTNPSPLRHGVYRSCAFVDGTLHHAVTNVGVCPTFAPRAPHAETHLLACDCNLYGKKIDIFLLGYLRPEREFTDEKTLKMQIELDIKQTLEENGELRWQEIGRS